MLPVTPARADNGMEADGAARKWVLCSVANSGLDLARGVRASRIKLARGAVVSSVLATGDPAVAMESWFGSSGKINRLHDRFDPVGPTRLYRGCARPYSGPDASAASYSYARSARGDSTACADRHTGSPNGYTATCPDSDTCSAHLDA